MKAPQGWRIDDMTWSWSHPTGYRIEYELWLAGGAVRMREFASHFRAKYHTNYSQANLTNRMAELVDLKKVVHVSRGIYVHRDHAHLVEATDAAAEQAKRAPTLADLLA